MCKLMASVLEVMGVGAIYMAANGEDGFQKFQKHGADIVLTDWHMEPMNGIELTREIRTNMLSANRMAPVILMTGYSAYERIEEARNAGITEFLVKPFSANDLAKRITYVINKPRDFIDAPGYFGPDRRRKIDQIYKGPFRREEDGKSVTRKNPFSR